jgi:hypothetical protein
MHIKPMYGEGMQDPVWIKSVLSAHNAAWTAFSVTTTKIGAASDA